MLRVTIELLPHGREEGRKVVASGEIWNDGTGAEALDNYVFMLCRRGGKHRGEVRYFPRLKLGPWDLLFRCLREAVGKRNK